MPDPGVSGGPGGAGRKLFRLQHAYKDMAGEGLPGAWDTPNLFPSGLNRFSRKLLSVGVLLLSHN